MKIAITCNANKLTKQEKVERIVAEERVTEKEMQGDGGSHNADFSDDDDEK